MDVFDAPTAFAGEEQLIVLRPFPTAYTAGVWIPHICRERGVGHGV